MKNFKTILIVVTFLSLAFAFCVYAEETTTDETVNAVSTETTAMPVVASAASVSTPEQAVEATPAPVSEKTTLENLQAAFNGESNAHARYLAFAKKADEEGYGKVASLFRAAARSERIHFQRYAKILKKMGATPKAEIETPVVKTTEENLQTALEGETAESTQMYPGFAAKAKLDKNEDAVGAFEGTAAVEAVHASLFKKASEDLPAWKGAEKKFYVCLFCGNVVEKIDFENCSICGKSKDQFVTVW